MSVLSFMQLLDALRERAQKGELTVSPEGWAELEEIVGKREVSARRACACARVAAARD